MDAKRATLRDVAAAAVVSRALAGFVLGDDHGKSIPEATRERVRAAARSLGYAPHAIARALLATQYAPASGGGPGGPPPATASDLTDAVPVLGATATTTVVRQINLYPYPELPAYNGYGNVDAASSYAGKVSEALQQPVQWLGKFDSTTTWCNDQGTDCKTTYGSW